MSEFKDTELKSLLARLVQSPDKFVAELEKTGEEHKENRGFEFYLQALQERHYGHKESINYKYRTD